MKGQLIMGKSNSFYNINNNLIKAVIRGNNNTVINPHKITELFINGNNNNIEIVRGGKINNIKVFGNNNEIRIKNNSYSNYLDQGIGNSIIRNNNNIPFLAPNPMFFNNNINLDRFNPPFHPRPFNPQNRVVDNIMNKLEEHNYYYISPVLKNENEECSLCAEAFYDNQKVKIFTCKKHVFHSNCLKDYIKNTIDNLKCPKCNQSFNVNNNTSIDNGMESPIFLNINAPPLNPRHYFLRHNRIMQGRPRRNVINHFHEDDSDDDDLNEFRYLNLSERVRNLLQRIDEIGSHLNSLKKGLDKNILDNMEISKIKDVDKLDADKKKCTICLEDYVNGDNSIALPCIHIFHANCIKTWLKENNSCPICKNEIKYENEELDLNGEFQ